MRTLFSSAVFLLYWAVFPGSGLHGQSAADTLYIQYLANEGVYIRQNGHHLLVDPLFSEDFGTYQRVPVVMEDRMLTQQPPFHLVEAIFVSHRHADHFDPDKIARFLANNRGCKLVAAEEVIAMIDRVKHRIGTDQLVAMTPEVHGPPQIRQIGGLHVSALWLRHGNPRNYGVVNLAFRVENGGMSWIHLGDAEVEDPNFQDPFWENTPITVALVPVWFALSADGKRLLKAHLSLSHLYLMHVPAAFEEVKAEVEALDAQYKVLTAPGEGYQVVKMRGE